MSESPRSRSFEASQELIAPLLKEKVDRYVLPNGLTVVMKPSKAAAVCSVQVWVKTGSIHEGKHLGAGISHFLEHMLFKGTTHRAGREISETVQSAGGYINAYTTFDRTVYYIDIPSENVDVALDVLSDAIFHSTLPEDEVEKEREVIQREIDMGEDDPDSKLTKALFETAFRSHHYRYPIIGYKEVFSQLNRDDLFAYYKSRYVPNNMVLVISGDYIETSMKAKVEKYFGAESRQSLSPVLLTNEPAQLASRARELLEDVQVTRIGLGYQVPGLTHEDTPILDTLSIILGHGHSSLLNLRLREEKRLVHNIDSTNWTPGSVGVFYLSLLCDPDKSELSVAETLSFIEGLQVEDFSEELIDKAIRQLLVSEVNARKTVSGQASRLGAAEVVVGDIGYAGNYLKTVSRVTASDLHRVLKKWLRSDRLTKVAMNPKEEGEAGSNDVASAGSGLEFNESKQENGSALLWRKDDRLPNLHFRFVMQAGSLFEGPNKQGLTSLLATMLTKDTEHRTSAEVAAAIEGVGGNFYEFSGNNSLGLALEILPSDVDLALDLLEQALLHPKFDETTFAIEKEAQVATIKEQEDDIVSAGRRELRRKFFGEHPFSISGSGSLDTIAGLEVADLKSFLKKIFVSENACLAVSGQFNETELLPKLERFLAHIDQGEVENPGLTFRKPAETGSHRKSMDRHQAVVFHAYPGPGLKDDDFYVSEVADELFSGMSSVLFERVREELSLAYFVRSSRIIGLDTAMFFFCAGSSPERYGEVIQELVRERDRVANGEVEESELTRCKTRLKAARRMGMQTNAACAGQAAMNVTYGLPANDWRNYDERIEAVGIKDLQRFATHYLNDAARVELVIGAV